MGTYRIVKEADGNLRARSAQYDLKNGEQEVGSAEGTNADEALRAYEDENEGEVDDDRDTRVTGGRRPVSQEEAKRRDEAVVARDQKEREEQEFTVMSDQQGHYFVEGDEESDPTKKEKARAAANKPKEEEGPVEVGKFRAKDAHEALEMAQGRHHSPAEGQPRGAQTP